MKLDKIIVDADICIKLGTSEKYLLLEKLLPLIAENIYIHPIVYDEIRYPFCAKSQIEKLIEAGIIEIIGENSLSDIEKLLYDATYISLSQVMINKNEPNKNKGEVSSLAIAKVKMIPIFDTDEKDLQPIINKKLNNGINDITCLRIIDIITKIKVGEITGLNRKEAKILWCLSGKSKEYFDEVIWRQ